MSDQKRLFLSGSIIGGVFGIFLFMIVFFFFYFDGRLFQKVDQINYQVNINSAVSDAIRKASPCVVGVVRFKADQESGTGSGVIYKITDQLAYIITNHHVIANGTKIEVAFQNGNRVQGSIVGDDVITDLAVITIPKGNLTETIDFSDSNHLQMGDFVFVIGNPLGLKFYGSATLGIVSSTERLIPIDSDKDGENDWFATVIQTDAAINPGNSGGALVNIDGKLIGINSMKIAGNSVEGLGFSIPSNIVYSVVQDIENYGEVRRPYLGFQPVSFSKLTETQKTALNLGYITKGVYVNDVVPFSSASQAGLKINDIITKVNDEDIVDAIDFRLKLYEHKLGDEITLTIIRHNTVKEVTLQLEPKDSYLKG